MTVDIPIPPDAQHLVDAIRVADDGSIAIHYARSMAIGAIMADGQTFLGGGAADGPYEIRVQRVLAIQANRRARNLEPVVGMGQRADLGVPVGRGRPAFGFSAQANRLLADVRNVGDDDEEPPVRNGDRRVRAALQAEAATEPPRLPGNLSATERYTPVPVAPAPRPPVVFATAAPGPTPPADDDSAARFAALELDTAIVYHLDGSRCEVTQSIHLTMLRTWVPEPPAGAVCPVCGHPPAMAMPEPPALCSSCGAAGGQHERGCRLCPTCGSADFEVCDCP